MPDQTRHLRSTLASYDFNCHSCETTFEVSRPMSQAADPAICPDCGKQAARVFTVPGMVFQGDGWASKNERIRGQMARKTARLDKAQESWRHDGPKMTLAPNVEGERTDTWSEAKGLAASKGKDVASYDAMIRKEATT